MQDVIQSVGIDIGTTTSQLVFSTLHLRNLAGVTQVPRYAITKREILYQSPVAFTPFQKRGQIDALRLKEMIGRWYAEAGKSTAEIEIGAVIVTGESLKASNARAVVMDMVADLGDFVVASAGPHLESVLAGRGAGAAARSLAQHGYHLNIDIGGGTSNYVVFERGRVVDTACLNVGGRLIEVHADGRISYISEPAQPIVHELVGHGSAHNVRLEAVAKRMAEMIYLLIQNRPDALCHQLLQTAPLQKAYDFASIRISGGIGACWSEEGNPYRYGDMGPLLADALRSLFASTSLTIELADHSSRATVIGAGAWSLTLSGGTVWAQQDTLPLRNIPVALIPVDWKAVGSNMADSIAHSVARLDLDADENFVLCFSAGSAVNYATVQWLAQSIHAFYESAFFASSRMAAQKRPILVSVEDDMGKILGLELRSLTSRPLVIIDEVRLEDGDYVDLGSPLAGDVVPLTIKSLAFPVSAS